MYQQILKSLEAAKKNLILQLEKSAEIQAKIEAEKQSNMLKNEFMVVRN